MKHVHLIGIGGSGLSAIARLLLEKGYRVSGSDQTRSPYAVELEQAGARVYIGHEAQNIQGAQLVIRSSAIPDTNIEVMAARDQGIPVLKRSEFLGQLLKDHLSIAVAGTHGKTTTTSMIAWMLTYLDQQPSFIIGGVAKNLGCNAHAGGGLPFVIEADEYDRMFLGLNPDVMVILNAEHDHPDCFPTPEIYRTAFVEFVQQLRSGGMLLTNYDDVNARSFANEVTENRRAFTFGTNANADYSTTDLKPNLKGGFSFNIEYHGQSLGAVALQVPGKHNACNALAALAVAHQLHLNLEEAARALEAFVGTSRRFDILGEAKEITIINDYGHHPTEIRATLAAARSRYADRRIWAVWQPHTYSRSQMLIDEFANAFDDADQVIVSEIYASREKNSTFSALEIVNHMPAKAQFIPTLAAISQHLITHLKPSDVLIVFSAGDADQVSSTVLTAIQSKEK